MKIWMTALKQEAKEIITFQSQFLLSSYHIEEISSFSYSNLHTLILCSLRTLSLCHSAALGIFLAPFTSTYLCSTLPRAACHYSLFHRLPPLLLHPPAPQSISSPLKPQALLSAVKPPSEPHSEESDRQTERNEPRKDTVDSSQRWSEVSLTLFKLCARERRRKGIQNICAAITCSNMPQRNATRPEAKLYVSPGR